MTPANTADHQLPAQIGLTLLEKTHAYPAGSTMSLRAEEFIAYETGEGCTCVRLTGHRVIKVRESTDQIDRLLRQAQTQANRLQMFDGTEQQKAA